MTLCGCSASQKKTRLIIVGLVCVFVLAIYNCSQTRSAGYASWYGEDFKGKKTANGEVFDPSRLTAAHKTLPFGTRLRVTHLKNKKEVIVTINDRGPYKRGRIIDLSEAAARKLDMLDEGVAKVRIKKIS